MKNFFNINTDAQGRQYANCYAGDETEACVTIKGKVLVLRGTPKLVLRKGSSVFGEQFFFQFLIKEVKEEYDAKTDHQTLEIYYPHEEGLSFIKESISFFDDVRNDEDGASNSTN